jgi:hypothetical protein
MKPALISAHAQPMLQSSGSGYGISDWARACSGAAFSFLASAMIIFFALAM